MKTAFLISIISIICLLSAISASSQNTPDSCQGTGSYCYADRIYRCEAGRPKFVEVCQYGCRNAVCVYEPLAPDVAYDTSREPPKPVSSENFILYASIGFVLAVSLLFYLRIRMRK